MVSQAKFTSRTGNVVVVFLNIKGHQYSKGNAALVAGRQPDRSRSGRWTARARGGKGTISDTKGRHEQGGCRERTHAGLPAWQALATLGSGAASGLSGHGDRR